MVATFFHTASEFVQYHQIIMIMQKRRHFLQSVAALGVVPGLSFGFSNKSSGKLDTQIACQQYPWQTFFQREGKQWKDNMTKSMEQLAATGIKGFEPSFDSMIQIGALQPFLRKHDLETYSFYVNSVLHDPGEAADSMDAVVRLAQTAKVLGIKIIVTNPSPISWGGAEDKTDDQLKLQAESLDALGARLRETGLTLAYHNHDSEMRRSAREFHHMMLGTDPENVSLCLDAHWIYRGSGNSQVALFDIVELYADRIVELHLRQSKDGIWTEAFGPGDIDYPRLAERLLALEKRPHLVLEQAVEKGTPHTMDAVKAHRESLAYAQEVFSGFLE